MKYEKIDISDREILRAARRHETLSLLLRKKKLKQKNKHHVRKN